MAKPGDVIENPRIGARVVFLRTGAETAGEMLEADMFVAPGAKAAPFRHVHPAQEERFRVVAGGSLTTWVSGNEKTLEVGQECVVPAGALHNWWNSSDSEVHVRLEVRPALTFDRALEAIYALSRNGVRDPLQYAVTFWGYRENGGFPNKATMTLMAALSVVGRLLGYNQEYAYPYAPNPTGDAGTEPR